MAELESVIEKRLIDQLCCEESQWTYRPDIRTEDQLWKNFKYILEQNNKAKLNDVPLSESEFAKVKNDLSHASFYDAGKWLVGENGKVYVHVQRGNEVLHLVVMNNEHVAGGTSVYEVINQYQAFKSEEDEKGRDRRFDVTLLINGIPMIHIELKNKEHPYMDGYRQIKKYISEGKFHGIFSNVQMFVVSNAVDTKYFAAARDTELNKKFLTGWIDEENVPVCDFIDFAKAVLRIPEAHEMVTKYTVLDNDKKQLLILRPYQIHAIEAMRNASKTGKSGFIWHTTGSGKTMTSYKATRNLLMDIPSIEKTVFLIDRKDLDQQTKGAFQSYADNDTIDVDDTDNVTSLISRLKDDNRQMIVTTRQKLQTMINKRLKEGTKEYDKIRALKVAFVVDECHRAVTPQTKRDIERFFRQSIWFGFTGTPIFEENKYEQKGDLAQTTEELYGPCLHSYTIKEAIHDGAVLGFNVENLGPKDISSEDEEKYYRSEAHMRSVLNIILNQSLSKFGMQNGKGQTYEAMLTVESIAVAQKYYNLLQRIKDDEDELK
jgi:type I restriction enzyme R subunit